MALSSGVYSLIGVGLGAVSTGGFQVGLAWRAGTLDARAARRVVSAELVNTQLAARFVARGTVSPDDGGARPADGYAQRLEMVRGILGTQSTYEEYAPRLARHLSDDAWTKVRDAYLEALSLSVIRDEAWVRRRSPVTLSQVDMAVAALEPPAPRDAARRAPWKSPSRDP